MSRARIVTTLAVVTAALTAATGVSYLADTKLDPPEARAYLATVAFLGASALVAVSAWQESAVARTRVIVLLILDALAAAYVAANSLALVAATPYPQPGGPNDTGLLGAPRPLHWVGLVAGAVLYLAALMETTSAVAEERRTRRDVSPA